jgi:hypothetical protein
VRDGVRARPSFYLFPIFLSNKLNTVQLALGAYQG